MFSLSLTKMRFESLFKDLDETLIIDPIAIAKTMVSVWHNIPWDMIQLISSIS